MLRKNENMRERSKINILKKTDIENLYINFIKDFFGQ